MATMPPVFDARQQPEGHPRIPRTAGPVPRSAALDPSSRHGITRRGAPGWPSRRRATASQIARRGPRQGEWSAPSRADVGVTLAVGASHVTAPVARGELRARTSRMGLSASVVPGSASWRHMASIIGCKNRCPSWRTITLMTWLDSDLRLRACSLTGAARVEAARAGAGWTVVARLRPMAGSASPRWRIARRRVGRCRSRPVSFLRCATPGTRTLPSFSNALTFAMACARIRSRAGSSTC